MVLAPLTYATTLELTPCPGSEGENYCEFTVGRSTLRLSRCYDAEILHLGN
jgi:hypothetical protein